MPEDREAIAARRRRIREVQVQEADGYDWREALRFARFVLAAAILSVAAGVALALVLGAGLDWLEGVLR